METVKFSMTFNRKTLTSVWQQYGRPWRISRSVTDIHKDNKGTGEKWIHGGNNDLYKAHASLSPNELEMYLYIEIDAKPYSSGHYAAIRMILDTTVFGSRMSQKLKAADIVYELSAAN